jgi:2-amino-4-hydroxy-6-hydroxymethyldihydropteridine diphosphokinase
MKRVFLLTGSNLGNSISLMNSALVLIGEKIGRVVQKSHVYRSDSWGYESSLAFYNQCLELETDLSPHLILEKILGIESKMGRARTGNGYTDRKMDIDILFFGEKIINDEKLTIPHPLMHLRRFALVPLNEIAGEFMHPVLKKSISELLSECNDESLVILN